jgi:hypothetical protein
VKWRCGRNHQKMQWSEVYCVLSIAYLLFINIILFNCSCNHYHCHQVKTHLQFK